MKVFNSIFILLFAVVTANAQEVKWDSTYRPASYQLRLAQFRMFPNAKTDVIFLGNSITAGVEWQELTGNPNARNRGISGDITFGVLNRLDEVTEGQPAKVFILIGINDVARSIPDSVTTANHRRMVQYIKTNSPSTKIYLQTLLPVNKDLGKHKAHYNKDEIILRINENLKKIAKEEKVELIDLYPHFLGADGKLVPELTYDGLHLTADGYERWLSVLKENKAL
jgi:lysophospholipase L1-like esterase